jgi:hypothetical protein
MFTGCLPDPDQFSPDHSIHSGQSHFNTNIMLSPISDVPNAVFPYGFPTKILYPFYLSRVSCTSSAFHFPILDHSHVTWRKAQVMKLHVSLLSAVSYQFFPLCSMYSYLPLFNDLSIRDRVSHPYRRQANLVRINVGRLPTSTDVLYAAYSWDNGNCLLNYAATRDKRTLQVHKPSLHRAPFSGNNSTFCHSNL